ncbi:MAG: signal recognition particle receptor subunit alpha, partial [Vulcanococcus sp.]
MVYDWFTRSAAPEEGETPQPEEQAVAPPASESAPSPAPAAAEVAPAADPGVDQDALEWARQAYARLKAQQEAEKQQAAQPPSSVEPPAPGVVAPVEAVAPPPPSAPQPESEPSAEPAPPVGLSLLEQAAAQRAQRQQELLERAIDTPPPPAPAPAAEPTADEAAPQLGAFDDDFTWSAEVLAAQGRQLDQISLEEIDWLGRLRRGMEKTRQGFVTQLLENLGDDPLTPEVLDDLETLLLRADVGVQATDQVLEALRKRLNEEVVEPEEGIRFLKQQLRNLLDTPIQASGAALLAPERGRLNV